MKTFILALLTLIFASTSNADCRFRYENKIKQSPFRYLDINYEVIGIISGGSTIFLAPGAAPVVGVILGGFLVAEGIKEIHNHRIKKMIKLINQSEELINGEDINNLKLLKRTKDKVGGNFTYKDFAQSIFDGNYDLTLCPSLEKYHRTLKRINDGDFKIVHLD